jgi:hypothetical protein
MYPLTFAEFMLLYDETGIAGEIMFFMEVCHLCPVYCTRSKSGFLKVLLKNIEFPILFGKHKLRNKTELEELLISFFGNCSLQTEEHSQQHLRASEPDL